MNVSLRPPPQTEPPLNALLSTRHRINVGFLCPHNPFDRRAFSGTAFHALQALKTVPGLNMRVLGPHRPPTSLDRLSERFFKTTAPRPDPDQLDLVGLDAVFGLVASPLLDRLSAHSHLPFIHATDATPAFLREFYGWDFPASAEATEARVLGHATSVLFSSRFMAERAMVELDPTLHHKTHIAPFGINCDTLPESCPQKPPLSRLQLLFVCSDWDRKGGDTALATLDQLRAAGVNVQLTIAGHVPAHVHRHPGVRLTGYLNKNNPKDTAQLTQLYRQSHLLLLPTRADCTPMVLAESMAHGTPVLTTDVGAIASLLGGPNTGQMLALSASHADWAQAVLQWTSDPAGYARRSKAAFAHARGNLTWTAWANKTALALKQAVVPKDHKNAA